MLSNRKGLRDLRKTIGRNIYNYRLEQRMTLRKLSLRTGIGITSLDQYEIGKSAIRLEELALIAGELGIKLEELL